MRAAESGEIGARELSNTAYGAAKALSSIGDGCGRGGSNFLRMLFVVLVPATELLAAELSVQNLVNAAWAFAKIDQSDAVLCRALANVAARRVCEFRVQDLAVMA
eukprot:gnl/TRDRNA2_/TRDRNA2_90353_c1_seq1.p1 gnl/TRDRNA2_/TRDRNA2_90353_c1~~gnl/TRDRNA2_/TRDRNA2_90353_c1_seq1.p1  ORF type:complete len:105 (+),score=14.44 gnl/TRDRNA2_/TRDRNA2_90353_c1_seq1:188-502(+)